MSQVSRFSLWLIPEESASRRFDSIIKSFSEKYHSPQFRPHITLLGSFEGMEDDLGIKIHDFVSQMGNLKIQLESIDYLPEYYRCLFIRAAKTPELLKMNQSVKGKFNLPRDPGFMPHLSLVYGNFPESIKIGMIDQVGEFYPKDFLVKRMDWVETRGEIRNWKLIRSFDLRQPPLCDL